MKQMKVLTVFAALAMTLGLSACGGKKDCTHKWGKWEEVTPATCTVAGVQRRTCEKCKKTEEKPIAAGHKWGEWEEVTPSTCKVAGTAKRVCSACQAEDTKALDLADHTWGEWEEVTPASCTEAGVRKHTCSVCDEEEEGSIPATGHTYAKVLDGEGQPTEEDLVDWIAEPTCTKAGYGEKECTVCHEKATVTQAALGHDLQPEPDDGIEPKEDFAKVRMYSCTHGCGKAYFGFNANEVTAASKEHLVIDANGGARFWGRPIGNDVVLNDDGDPDENSHDAVFNDQQPGDFFEYKFTLTDDQVGKYYLYCEATPAQWMRNNGMDFFACKPGDTDWTRGMYIDDIPETEENEKGQDIDDYRYILYVDDQPKAFDDSITNPVTSDNKAEFILPYEFDLHSGDNSISLRMAGGYRSVFHKFTFRSIEEKEPEHEHVWVEQSMPEVAAGETIVKKYTCIDPTCTEKVKYEIEAKTANWTLAEGSAWKTDPTSSADGAFKLNKDGHSASFTFALDKAFSGKIYQYGYMDGGSSNASKSLYYQTNNHANIEVKINDQAVAIDESMATKTFNQVLTYQSGATNSDPGLVLIGNASLALSNTLSYKRVETLNMLITKIVFIGNEAAA